MLYFHNLEKDNLLHTIGFRPCKFSFTEINYEIHDKKNLAIVDAFEERCHLLEGIQHKIIVYSDHKNFQYFITAHVLK